MSVYRRRDTKRFEYRFSHQGKRYSKGGFATYEEAAKAEIEARRRAGLGGVTFRQMVGRRIEHVAAYCTHTHYRDTKALLRAFASWGDLLLTEITPQMVKDRILELAKQTTPHNVNRHLRAVKALFNMAVADGFLDKNPAKSVKPLPVQLTKKVVPTTGEVAQTILKAPPMERSFLTVIWQTGARVGEVSRLTWQDVDFQRNCVTLWTRKKRGGVLTPREIPMTTSVRRALEYAWKHRQPGSPWVFTNPRTGTRYGYRWKLIKRLSGGKFTYHHLRHNAASALAERGTPLPVIQQVLGHERATTTDRYLSLIGQEVRTALEGIDAFMDTAGNTRDGEGSRSGGE